MLSLLKVSEPKRIKLPKIPGCIFLNYSFLWLTKSDIPNSANDNTLSVTSKELEKVPRAVEGKSNSAVNWFKKLTR